MAARIRRLRSLGLARKDSRWHPVLREAWGSTRLRGRLPLPGLHRRLERPPSGRQSPQGGSQPGRQPGAGARQQGHLRQPRVPVRGLCRGSAASQCAAAVEGGGQEVSHHQLVAEQTTPWHSLWPLLLTALLTLLITSWVQLVVVPRAETRKRRDDRWERDLLALGDLLAVDQPRVSLALKSAIFRKMVAAETIREIHNDPSGEGRQADKGLQDEADKGLREADERLREARDAYDRMDTRIAWLLDRIESIDAPSAEGMLAVHDARLQYLEAAEDLFTVDRLPATQELDEAYRRERAAVKEIVAAVKGLLGHPPPRPSSRKRLRQSWDRIARRQAARDSRVSS
jgi:hypothetical protein